MFNKLFSSQYLFDPAFDNFSRSDKVYFAFAIFLVLYGVLLVIVKRRSANPVQKALFDRLRSWAFTFGVLGLVWSALRYERIQTIGTHFVILMIYLLAFVTLIPKIRYWLNEYKPEKEAFDKEQLKNKYIK